MHSILLFFHFALLLVSIVCSAEKEGRISHDELQLFYVRNDPGEVLFYLRQRGAKVEKSYWLLASTCTAVGLLEKMGLIGGEKLLARVYLKHSRVIKIGEKLAE